MTETPDHPSPFTDDLSRWIHRLNRVNPWSRQRLANDPATRALVAAGLRLLYRNLGLAEERAPTREPADDTHRAPLLQWLSRADVVNEVENRSTPTPPDAVHHSSIPTMRDRWNPHGNYIADLLTYALSAHHYLDATRIAMVESVDDLVQGDDLVAAIHSTCYWDAIWQISNPAYRVQLLGILLANQDANIGSAVGEMYQAIGEKWKEVHRATLAAHGLELRRGISADDLAHMITAAAEGLALRALADPAERSVLLDEREQTSMFGKMTLAIVAGCIQSADDPSDHSIEDFVAGLVARRGGKPENPGDDPQPDPGS